MKKTLTLMVAIITATISIAQPMLVKDIKLGSGAGCGSINNFFIFNNKLLFTANDGINGFELWQTDGTTTSMVYDIYPGAKSSTPHSFCEIGNMLYFIATDSLHGIELFKWDGVNPVAVIDFYPGKYNGVGDCAPTSYNGKLYFVKNDSAAGEEPWIYDPVSNTDYIVADMLAGPASSSPHWMIVYNNKLYFNGWDGTEDVLYVHDAVAGTSKMVSPTMVSPMYPAIYNNHLYFAAFQELYHMDNDTPKRLTDMVTGQSIGLEFLLYGNVFGFLGNSVYLRSRDYVAKGEELYKYDTSTKTISKVFDFNSDIIGGRPEHFVTYKNKLFFSANNGDGHELWEYNGSGNPKMVADIYPGSVGGTPRYMTVFNNVLYFFAQTNNTGMELFRYNDTTTGNSLQNVNFKANVNVYPNPATSILYMDMQLETTQQLSVTLTDIAGKKLYTTGFVKYNSGTHKLTIPVQNLPAGTYYYNMQNIDGTSSLYGSVLKL